MQTPQLAANPAMPVMSQRLGVGETVAGLHDTGPVQKLSVQPRLQACPAVAAVQLLIRHACADCTVSMPKSVLRAYEPCCEDTLLLSGLCWASTCQPAGQTKTFVPRVAADIQPVGRGSQPSACKRAVPECLVPDGAQHWQDG